MDEAKQELISKTLELFKKYGVRSVTTNDIANELGISKKTLYEYYTDKSDIVEKAITLMFERLNTQYLEVKQKRLDAISTLFQLYEKVSELLSSTSPILKYDLQKYYPALSRKLWSQFNGIIYNMHVENIEQGKQEGVYRDVDADVVARLLVLQCQLNPLEVFSKEEVYSGKVCIEIFLLHIYGICNERGYAKVGNMLKENSNSPNYISID